MATQTGWNIRPPDMGTFLENLRQGTFDDRGLEASTTFTILRNAIRGETEIAELVAATGADSLSAGEMVTLRLERLVLFETVAALETEVQMKEDDLKPLVLDVYRHHMKPSEPGKAGLKQAEATIQKIAKFESLKIMHEIEGAQSDVSKRQGITKAGGPEAEALETFDNIKDRLLSGAYKPAEIIFDADGKKVFDPDEEMKEINANATALAMTQKVLHDKCYVKKAQDYVKKYVDDKLKRVIDKGVVKYPKTDKPLQRLSTHTGDDRDTFMLAGAPACGKGTIVALMEVQAREQLGVDWNDTVKINTDNHREIVSAAAGLGDDITVHSDLNDFEASYITNRANARVQAQLDNNSGHHLVIDGVYPSVCRFKMGTQNKGSLHVACVSVPVDVSVERAFNRGQEIGRFVGSEYLVTAHKSVSADLLKNMVESCVDTGAELSIFNTNVPRGTQPIQAMQLDMSTKKAIIYDAAAMAEIYGKRNIDPKALDSAHLYPDEAQKADYSYVSELDALHITIEFATPEMQHQVEELIHSNASIYKL